MHTEKMTDAQRQEFVIKQWSEDEFSCSEEDWSCLLGESDANPLFMSWAWHFNWWKTYSDQNCRLSIFAAYSGGMLVGIAPLYLEKNSYLKGLIPIRRLQFIGKRYEGAAGIRAEYLSFIVSNQASNAIITSLVEKILRECNWDEICLSDIDTKSETYVGLIAAFKLKNLYGRIDDLGSPYLINTNGEFSDYLSRLGKNTRLKLYNRRRLMSSLGALSEEVYSKESHDVFFRKINEWHAVRWNKPAFKPKNLQFLIDVCQASSGAISLEHSSMLKLDEEPLSVAINLTVQGCAYNIQLGFKADFDKRVSLGLLHLGFLIEKAYTMDSLHSVNLLEGKGKNSDYKSRISEVDGYFENSRWFRSGFLKLMFKLYDRYWRS